MHELVENYWGIPVAKNYLLLTATISPETGQSSLLIQNPEERLLEYEKALQYYHRNFDRLRLSGLIFVENSDFDLSLISKKYPSGKFEWISAPRTPLAGGVHRGYGEFLMIDYAFRNSLYLTSMSPSDVVWKVSGRYVLKNLGRMIFFAPDDYDVYADIRKNWVELSVISWSKKGFLEYFQPCIEEMKVDFPPEVILARAFDGDRSMNVVSKFTWLPYINGRRGANGVPYMSARSTLRHFFAQAMNVARIFYRHAFGKDGHVE